MVRRQKTKVKIEQAKGEEEEEGKAQEGQGSVIFLSSSDEDEANEDLSLEIVAKARMREAKRKREEDFDEFKASDGARLSEVIDLSSASSDEIEFLVDRSGGGAGSAGNAVDAAELKRKKKKKKKKSKKIEEEEENKTVDAVEAQEQVENIVAVEAVTPDVIREEEQVNPVEAISTAILEETKTETDEVNPVEAVSTAILEETKTETDGPPDNPTMRQYLRGPRYFDPPDCFLVTCYNCNEEGHRAANCTAKKRKKPCFVCGSLDHGVRNCTQGLECYICKRKGHRRKDCPEKGQRIPRNYKICLRCGNLGHEMFSCSNAYAVEDLKEITCYMCNKVGHLCCVDFVDTSPGEVSCYNCGQAGHYGLGCAKLRRETSGASAPSATVCFRCGEEGHYKRGCPQMPKLGLGIGESSAPTKTKRFPKETKNKLGSHSAPHDLSKARKKKSTQLEEREFSAAKKPKQKTGWITDDPGDLPNRKAKAKIWRRSPVTPPTRRNYNVTAGGYHPNSYSPWPKPKFYPGTPPSHYGLPNNSYQQRFSASRFGNVPGCGGGTPYHW